MITPKKLAETLLELAGQYETKEVVDEFVSLARRRGLEYLLPQVAAYLERKDAQEEVRMSATLTSSHKISGDTQNAIGSHIGVPEDKDFDVEVDPYLIGGFIAQYNYKRYDASIRTRLDKLRHTLLH